MDRRDAIKLMSGFAVMSGLTPLVALAQAKKAYEELKDAPGQRSKTQVEVIEFFSYACQHCHDFEPFVEKWRKSLPAYVEFRRVPVSFGRPQWERLGRLYYALEALSKLEANQAAVFRGLHEDKMDLAKDDELKKWAGKQGLDANKLIATMDSFGVNTRIKQAEKDIAAFQVNGVPSMAVAGRYMVSTTNAGSFPGMLTAVDDLAAKQAKILKK